MNLRKFPWFSLGNSRPNDVEIAAIRNEALEEAAVIADTLRNWWGEYVPHGASIAAVIRDRKKKL